MPDLPVIMDKGYFAVSQNPQNHYLGRSLVLGDVTNTKLQIASHSRSLIAHKLQPHQVCDPWEDYIGGSQPWC